MADEKKEYTVALALRRNDRGCEMVRPEGFEPPTLRSVV